MPAPPGVTRRHSYELQGQARLPLTEDQMHVTIAAGPFAAACNAAARVASTVTTLPILRNVLIEASLDTLRLVATDLQLTLDMSLSAMVAAPGKITVPAKMLAELAGKLGNAELTLTLDGTRLKVSTATGDYTLAGLSEDDFPAVTNPATANPCAIESTLLREALTQVMPFPDASDTTNASNNSLHLLASPGSLLLVGVTGRAMGRRGLLVPSLETEYNALIHVSAVKEIVELLKGDPGTCTLCVDNNQVSVTANKTVLTVRTQEGKTPKLTPFNPANNRDTVTLHREGFLAAIRRLQIIADKAAAHQRVEYAFTEDELTLTSETDSGKIIETLALEEFSGELFDVLLDSFRTAVALQSLASEHVILRFQPAVNDKLKPVCFTPSDGTDQQVWFQQITR